jgi:glycosyltransferase involved in cell wall biosynthesis
MALPSAQYKFKDLSILVSCFNKEDFIPKFISEAVALNDLGAEIIVINDGSTDNSAALLHKVSSVFQIIHTENLGVASARNLAIFSSNRPYIVFLDIDDSLDLDSLNAGMLEIRNSKSDLVVSSYIRIQDGSISNVLMRPNLCVDVPIKFESRFSILNGMGFWRYIYSRDFILANKLKFFPSFEEMNGKFFILDDYFWMLHLASIEKFSLHYNFSEIPLYKYFYEIPQPPDKWKSFTRQVRLFPQAFKVFEVVLATCIHNHDDEWLIFAGREGLARHLNYLDFFSFLRSLPELLSFILNSHFFFAERKLRLLVVLVFGCGSRTFRNSLAILKKDVLSSVKKYVTPNRRRSL